MNSKKSLLAIIGLFCAIMLVSTPLYAKAPGVKVGKLEIRTLPATNKNLIIRSSVECKATFTDENGKKEYYIGEMGVKLGVDLSWKEKEELFYVVFSAAKEYKTGSYALQGKYFGQKAAVIVKGGPSVQVLLGGFDKSFTLQPLAVGGAKGVGAAAGLGYLYLQKDPTR